MASGWEPTNHIRQLRNAHFSSPKAFGSFQTFGSFQWTDSVHLQNRLFQLHTPNCYSLSIYGWNFLIKLFLYLRINQITLNNCKISKTLHIVRSVLINTVKAQVYFRARMHWLNVYACASLNTCALRLYWDQRVVCSANPPNSTVKKKSMKAKQKMACNSKEE